MHNAIRMCVCMLPSATSPLIPWPVLSCASATTSASAPATAERFCAAWLATALLLSLYVLLPWLLYVRILARHVVLLVSIQCCTVAVAIIRHLVRRHLLRIQPQVIAAIVLLRYWRSVHSRRIV